MVYKPIFNTSGELISTDEKLDIENIMEVLKFSGYQFIQKDGFTMVFNRHGNPVSGPLQSDKLISFLMGMVCGMSQPSKYQEGVNAFLVKQF